MLWSSLCDYSNAYILVKGTITPSNTAAAAAANNVNKKVIFKNCVPFTNCISKIDDIHDNDVVTPMYNLIEYSNNYLKISAISGQNYRDELALDNHEAIVDFTADNAITDSFKIKEKMNVEIMVPLKYLSNFWRILEMPFINCEISLDLNWLKNCVTVATNLEVEAATFSITDTKL